MSGISNKVMSGALWMMACQWMARLLGIVSTLILARLLLPDDYGIVAIVSIVVGFIENALSTGAEPYLIRKENTDKIHYDTAWSFRLLVYLLVGLILFFGAEGIAFFFNDFRVKQVLEVISFFIVFSGLQNIGLVALKKELKFKIIFYHAFLQKLIGFIVTVYLAYELKSYWAMIIGTICIRLSDVILSYVLSSYRPRFTLQGFSEQWDFTKWLYIKNISGYISVKADQVIIGKILGSHSVGLYSMANELANLPASELIYPAATPIYSGYAKLANDVQKLNTAFIAVIGVISVIAFPLLTGMYVLAEELVRVALGKNWLEAVPVLKLSVILALVQLYYLAFSTLLMVNSRGIRILTFIDCGFVLILVPLLFYLSKLGDLFTVLLSRTLLAFFVVLLLYIIVWLTCHVKFSRLLRVIIRPFFVSLCMKILLEKIELWITFTGDISEIFYKTTIGGTFYFVSIMLLWTTVGKAEGGERFLIYKIMDYIKINR